MTIRLALFAGLLVAPIAFAAPSEAEKAKKAAEKKLDAFEKAYGKDLSRKSPEKLEQDIAALDEALAALKAVDAPAAAALAGRRDTLVEATRTGLASAKGEKAEEKLEKKFAKLEADFDPTKKRVAQLDPKAIERTRKELDALIAPLPDDAKKTWEGKRDALFAKLETDRAETKLADERGLMPEAPAVGAIAPMAPTWCDGVLESRPALFANYHPRGLALNDGVRVEGLEAVIAFSCVDPTFDRRQQWVAAWRATALQAGLSAANSERLLKLGAALFKANAKAAAETTLCGGLAPLEGGTAEDRALRTMVRAALSCRSKEGNAYMLGDADLPGGLKSQLARVQLVMTELATEPSGGNESYQLSEASGVGTVLAAAPLDPAAFEKELEAMALEPFGQARAIIAFYGAQARVEAWRATMKKLAPKVPGLDELVFDAPVKAVAAFDKNLAKTKPLIDLIVAMEAQRGNMAGCAQKLWKFLPDELQGKKEPVNALEFDTPTGPLLTYALTLCGRNDPEVPVMETVFRAWAERSDPVRGPIGAAYQGYVAAFNARAGNAPRGAFDADKRAGGQTLGLPAPGRSPVTQPDFGASVHGTANSLNRYHGVGGGVVKAVEAKGVTVRFTFKTETFKVPDYSCVETNKVDRITPEGQIVYRSACTKVGEHEETSTLEPVEVPAWAAGGVKAGSYLTATMLPNGLAKGRGWILEAWDSKARGKRTSLFGVPQ